MTHQAPWGAALVLVSTLATLVLIGIPAFIAWSTPVPGGVTALMWGLPLLLLFGCLLFCVRGYRLDGGQLYVRRLLSETAVDLRELQSVEADPKAMKGSLRTFGNGGLFSFSGLHYSKKLGSYRAYVTDFKRSVVLRLPGRSVVVSPRDPARFVDDLAKAHPHVKKPERSDAE